MCTIALVRHGETDWNIQRRLQGREDTDLNLRGREQARMTGLHLRNERWDAVLASPLRRAKETAEIIASKLGLNQLHVVEQFVERDFGLASGLTVEQKNERFPDGVVPGMEEREALYERISDGLRSVRQRFPGSRVVVVSHGGVINAALAMFTNGEIGSGKTLLGNACISLIHYVEDTWQIEYFNSTAHLANMPE